jgi:PPOX class probable F420-dependent enzyme
VTPCSPSGGVAAARAEASGWVPNKRRLCQDRAMNTEIPDTHLDLLEQPYATLATVGRGGIPQLTEIGYMYDGGEFKLSLNDSRVKTKNLKARPQCSLFILDLANPLRYVDVRGNVQIEPDDDYEFADRLGAKYETEIRKHDGPGENRVVVTIEPTNIFAVDMGA